MVHAAVRFIVPAEHKAALTWCSFWWQQLELVAAGELVYSKHSPVVRSYIVLRGTILLCNELTDRDGAEVRF